MASALQNSVILSRPVDGLDMIEIDGGIAFESLVGADHDFVGSAADRRGHRGNTRTGRVDSIPSA
jgi:hypothetical protein